MLALACVATAVASARVRHGVGFPSGQSGVRSRTPALTDEPTVPPLLLKANAATKWLVTAAQTGAVVARRDLTAPYIVVGSIGAAFATKALKVAINQQRPAGAPFTDPGMPSSHALVATFAAAAWALALRAASPIAALLLLLSAAAVSVLRVVTGYHTWPQIAVGAGLGAASATLWMRLGAALIATVPLTTRAMYAAVYAAYVGGSALFVAKKMREWSAKY